MRRHWEKVNFAWTGDLRPAAADWGRACARCLARPAWGELLVGRSRRDGPAL